jgi:hypothetical protein
VHWLHGLQFFLNIILKYLFLNKINLAAIHFSLFGRVSMKATICSGEALRLITEKEARKSIISSVRDLNKNIKLLTTSTSTRLAIMPVWFCTRLLPPAGYVFRYMINIYENSWI